MIVSAMERGVYGKKTQNVTPTRVTHLFVNNTLLSWAIRIAVARRINYSTLLLLGDKPQQDSF